ncbi:hypothetical protein [Mangrovivirga cuniculi]|uniref:Lipocalin-like domain-containing protein n=1 Tax=Mangrovivirga cuniculi TaxID=2715131 RepID=A0A4D7JWM0_9BACT|nr:hypothetical protein [Mangrovivirga cuniculi]QCK16862.1 hypothetical protein DCC35_20055 [Mangrovivirga cuniculi]
MKKNRILLALPLLFLALFINVSCDDDDDPQDPLVGLYILSDATTNQAIVDSQDNVIAPAGADITAQIAGALLSDVSCTDAANVRVQLTSGGIVNYLCKGEGGDPSQQGTWSVNDSRSQLLLTLNIGGTNVPVTLNNLDETGGNINGDVALQLPGSLFGVDDPFVSIDMNITFTEDTM